jgi:hypothetical protein
MRGPVRGAVSSAARADISSDDVCERYETGERATKRLTYAWRASCAALPALLPAMNIAVVPWDQARYVIFWRPVAFATYARHATLSTSAMSSNVKFQNALDIVALRLVWLREKSFPRLLPIQTSASTRPQNYSGCGGPYR